MEWKGSDIKRIRGKHGWTQVQFARLMNRSATQISRYESDSYHIPVSLFPLLRELDLNGCSVDPKADRKSSVTTIRNEIKAILNKTNSKSALLKILAFVSTVDQIF